MNPRFREVLPGIPKEVPKRDWLDDIVDLNPGDYYYLGSRGRGHKMPKHLNGKSGRNSGKEAPVSEHKGILKHTKHFPSIVVNRYRLNEQEDCLFHIAVKHLSPAQVAVKKVKKAVLKVPHKYQEELLFSAVFPTIFKIVPGEEERFRITGAGLCGSWARLWKPTDPRSIYLSIFNRTDLKEIIAEFKQPPLSGPSSYFLAIQIHDTIYKMASPSIDFINNDSEDAQVVSGSCNFEELVDLPPELVNELNGLVTLPEAVTVGNTRNVAVLAAAHGLQIPPFFKKADEVAKISWIDLARDSGNICTLLLVVVWHMGALGKIDEESFRRLVDHVSTAKKITFSQMLSCLAGAEGLSDFIFGAENEIRAAVKAKLELSVSANSNDRPESHLLVREIQGAVPLKIEQPAVPSTNTAPTPDIASSSYPPDVMPLQINPTIDLTNDSVGKTPVGITLGLICKMVADELMQAKIGDDEGLYERVAYSVIAGQDLEDTFGEEVPAKKSFVWDKINNDASLQKIMQDPEGLILSGLRDVLPPFKVFDEGQCFQEICSKLCQTGNIRESVQQDIAPKKLDEVVEALSSHPAIKGTLARLQTLHANASYTLTPDELAILQMHERPLVTLREFHRMEDLELTGNLAAKNLAQLVASISNKPIFVHKLCSLLFYLIKRRQGLAAFRESLIISLQEQSDDHGYSMRMLINVLLLNCEDLVRLKVLALLQHANPIPLTAFDLNGKLCFIPEPAWLIDDSTILLSYGLDGTKGKSSLLNRVFGTSFEVISPTLAPMPYFRGTIDLEAERNFITCRGFHIADAHGLLSTDMKHRILDLADAVILHVAEKLVRKDIRKLHSELKALKGANIEVVGILVRDASRKQNQDAFRSDLHVERLLAGVNRADLPRIIEAYIIPNLSSEDGSKFYTKQLRKRLSSLLAHLVPATGPSINTHGVSELASGSGNPENKFSPRSKQDKRQIYVSLLSGLEQEHFNEVMKSLSPLIVAIKNMVQHSSVTNSTFLHLYPKVYGIHKLQQRLTHSRFINRNDDEMQSRDKILELNQEIENATTQNRSVALALFETIVTSRHCTKAVYLLTNFMHEIYSLELRSFREEALHLKDQIRNGQEPRTDIEKIRKLSEVIDTKTVHIAIFWREVNQFFVKGLYANEVIHSFRKLSIASEPFEIIDGDALNFPKKFLFEAFEHSDYFKGKRICVISIVGPQNSGKSTLLNLMFGCTFSVSDGRTTKGVYGTLIESPVAPYDYFLLLDTEGIQAIEKGDPEYDRKVVLFALAVCDTVIINVKDEINEGMRKTFEICARSLAMLESNKMPQPDFFFVQNQKANIANTQGDAIQNIIHELKDIMPNISMDTLLALPSAFNTAVFEVRDDLKWRKQETSTDFVECVANFTQKVLSKIAFRTEKNAAMGIPFADLPSWVSFANDLYQTINKYEDLTMFNDMHEKSQDEAIRNFLKSEIAKEVRNEGMIKMFAEIKKDPDTSDKVITSIRSNLHQRHEVILGKFQTYLETIRASEDLRKRHKHNLEVQFDIVRQQLTVEAQLAAQTAQMEIDRVNGEAGIRNRLREILQAGNTYTEEQLVEFFEVAYKKSLDELVSRQAEISKHIQTIAVDAVYDTYKLYYPELPNPKAKEKLLLCKDPDAYFTHLTTKMAQKEFRGYTYPSGKPRDVGIDYFEQNSEWYFINNDYLKFLIGKIKKGENPHRSEFFIDHQPRLRWGQITANVWKYLGWKSKTSPLVSSGPSIQQFHDLAKALSDTLLHHGVILKKLCSPLLPFELVSLKAKEQKIQGRLPTSEIIQAWVGDVQAVIAHCDEDLRMFGLALSIDTKSNLHLLAVKYLCHGYFGHHDHNLGAIVKAFVDRKQENLDNFVQQALSGPRKDEATVNLIMGKLQAILDTACLERAQAKFGQHLDQFEKTSTRAQLQSQCDQSLNTMEENKLMEYTRSPASIIEKRFDELWEDTQRTILREVKQLPFQLGDTLLDLANEATLFSDFVKKKNQTYAVEIFSATGGAPLLEISPMRERATVQLFKQLLLCGNTSQQLKYHYPYQAGAVQLSTKLESNWSYSPTFHPYSARVAKILADNLSQDDMLGVVDLVKFTNTFAEQLKSMGQVFLTKEYTIDGLDSKKRLQDLREKAIGCMESCPCCGRCCDEEHWLHKGCAIGTEHNRHKCRQGHQYRAMAGVPFEKSLFASLKFCEDVKDAERILYQGKYHEWKEYKKLFPTWDFGFAVDSDRKQIESIRNKMAVVWQRIGKEICKIYNMKFTTKDESATEYSKHYMFAVDGSGSMKGAKWEGLQQALLRFIRSKMDNVVQHVASCVVFSHEAYITMEEEAIVSDMKLKLPFVDSTTDFGLALDALIKVAGRSKSNRPLVIVFMSDGVAEYPQAQIEQLTKSPLWDQLDSFWAVGFGKDVQVLHQMANAMEKNGEKKGEFKNPTTIDALINQYAEIARVT